MATDDKKPESTTPAQRAGEIPGIIWQSLFGAMAYDAYVARTEMKINPENAEAHLKDLEERIENLRLFIIDGVRDPKEYGKPVDRG